LRNFDQSNAATGANGTLTGTHAHIESALVARIPFAQAARGTWHFRVNDATSFEQRTNERDQFGPNAEPAEHQDGISQFFYINSLIEYIDYLHRVGDAAHNNGFGQGDFPDTYPNQDRPLIGNVHIPNVLNPPNNTNDPAFLEATRFGQRVLIERLSGNRRPTDYRQSNELRSRLFAKRSGNRFAVPYHEGMHSISSPIAGLEGSPEGDALNEGQADLWAYSAAENPALGAYVVNGFKLRELTRASEKPRFAAVPSSRGFGSELFTIGDVGSRRLRRASRRRNLRRSHVGHTRVDADVRDGRQLQAA
jgi:hypothetical protein